MKMTDVEKRVGDFCLRLPELQLESGCVHGLIGGNGCGKTCLLYTSVKARTANTSMIRNRLAIINLVILSTPR